MAKVKRDYGSAGLKPPNPKRRLRNVGDMEEAYAKYRQVHPRRRVTPEQFEEIVTRLGEGNSPYSHLSKSIGVHKRAPIEIDQFFKIRSPKERKDIRAAHAGNWTENREGGQEAIEQGIELLRGDATRTDIAAGDGVSRDVLIRLMGRQGVRSQRRDKSISGAAIAESRKQITAEHEKETIRLLKERRVVDGDFAHSHTEIAKKVGLRPQEVHEIWKNNEKRIKRSEEDNERIRRRTIGEAVKKGRTSDTREHARELMRTTLLGSKELIERMKAFDAGRSQTRSNQSYFDIIRRARGDEGLAKLPLQSEERERLAREEFEGIVKTLRNRNLVESMDNVAPLLNGHLPQPIAEQFLREKMEAHIRRGRFGKHRSRSMRGIKAFLSTLPVEERIKMLLESGSDLPDKEMARVAGVSSDDIDAVRAKRAEEFETRMESQTPRLLVRALPVEGEEKKRLMGIERNPLKVLDKGEKSVAVSVGNNGARIAAKIWGIPPSPEALRTLGHLAVLSEKIGKARRELTSSGVGALNAHVVAFEAMKQKAKEDHPEMERFLENPRLEEELDLILRHYE